MAENTEENGTPAGANGDDVQTACNNGVPDGGTGATEAPVCKCGAGVNATGERCRNGHLLPGHTSTLVVGHRSVAFWIAASAALANLVSDFLRDAGHSPADAPRALVVAAEGLAQATLIRDAAFDRLKVVGGPLSDRNDRARRAFTVWESASSSVERHAKLLGLKRRTKHVDPLEAVRQAVERANR